MEAYIITISYDFMMTWVIAQLHHQKSPREPQTIQDPIHAEQKDTES